LSKYVAPNLRGPKLVWVPSKGGWIFVGTIGIGGLVQLNSHYSSYDWVKHKSLMLSYPNTKSRKVKSKCYNIQVSWSSCGDLLSYLMTCKLFESMLAIGWSWDNQGISLVDHFIWVHMSWLN
jgi:hypothetical protein